MTLVECFLAFDSNFAAITPEIFNLSLKKSNHIKIKKCLYEL